VKPSGHTRSRGTRRIAARHCRARRWARRSALARRGVGQGISSNRSRARPGVYDSRTCAAKWYEEWRRPERRRWAWRCAAARGVVVAAAASRSFRSGGMYQTGKTPVVGRRRLVIGFSLWQMPTEALDEVRPCLAGLQTRLQQEPCQTVCCAPAPREEPPMEPLAASTREEEPGIGGSARLRQPFAIPAPRWGPLERGPRGRDGRRRGPAESGTRWPAASHRARPGRGGRRRA